MAYKQGSDTGGDVIGYLGFAAWIWLLRVCSELPSKGRYRPIQQGETIRMAGRMGTSTDLVIDALVEEHAQGPPIRTNIVTLSCIHLRRKIGKRPGLAG